MNEIEPLHQNIEEFKLNMKYPIGSVKKEYKKTICPVCLKGYMTRNRWNHERTQYHKTYQLLNDKLRKLIME